MCLRLVVRMCLRLGRLRLVVNVVLPRAVSTIGIGQCTFDDVVEIDTYRELKQLDETYRVD